MSKQISMKNSIILTGLITGFVISCSGNQMDESVQNSNDYEQGQQNYNNQQGQQNYNNQQGQQNYNNQQGQQNGDAEQQSNQYANNQSNENGQNYNYEDESGGENEYTNQYGDDYSANSNNSDSNEFNADNSAPFAENEYQTEGGDQAAAGEYEDTAGDNLNLGNEYATNDLAEDAYEAADAVNAAAPVAEDSYANQAPATETYANSNVTPENVVGEQEPAGGDYQVEPTYDAPSDEIATQNESADDMLAADTSEDMIASRAQLTWIGYDYRVQEAVVKIEVMTEGAPKYTMFQEVNQKGQPELVIRLYETDLRKKIKRDIDASEFRSPVAYIRMRENLEEDASDIILTLRDNISPQIFAENGNLLLTIQVPERYYGNNSIGNMEESTAQVISDAPIVTEYLSGSELPEGAQAPDMTNGAFEGATEGQEQVVSTDEYTSGSEYSTTYENGLPTNDFDNTSVISEEQVINNTYAENNTYAANSANSSNGTNATNKAGNYVNNNNYGANSGLNNINNGSNENNNYANNNYNQQGNNYNQQGNNYNQQGNNYNQQGNQANYNQNENYNNNNNNNYNQNYNNENLNENNIDDVNSGEGDSQYEENKFEVEVLHKTGLRLVSTYTFVSVAQDDYDLADDADVGDYGTNQEEANEYNTANTGANYSNNANSGANYSQASQVNNSAGNYAASNQTGNSENASGNYANNSGNGTSPYNVNTNNAYAAPDYEATDVGENTAYGNDAGQYDQQAMFEDGGDAQYDQNYNYGDSAEGEYIDLTGDEESGYDDAGAVMAGGGEIIKPVRMEFKDASLKDVITILGEENNTNFIYKEESVKDIKVNLSLKDVSWTDALRAVLETNGLGFIELPGGVVRIDKIEELKVERKDVREAKKAARQLIPTKVLMMRLSYAKAEEVAATIDTLLDKELDARSRVTIDNRTNTVIVEAVPEVLARMKSVIERVDTQTPQVKIEARIIEVQENNSENFGIQWGTPFNLNGATGLSLGGLNFPNSLTSSWAVDAPVDSTLGGKSRMKLGSINNIVELDLSLEWEEKRSTARILQNTSTIVLDNEQAIIESGIEDNIVSNALDGTRQVETIEYFLKLEVTPQITADGSVSLDVLVETADPGNSGVPNAFRKLMKKVETKFMRKSGETAVIGGVYTSQQDKAENGVPVLMDIPIIGALFKSTTTSIVKKEIIILLTPQILNGDKITAPATSVSTGSFASTPSYNEAAGDEFSNDSGGNGYNNESYSQNQQGYENEEGGNEYEQENDYAENGQNAQSQQGYNQEGNEQGYDQEGGNQEGNNQQGYNQQGNNQQGYNQQGNNQQGDNQYAQNQGNEDYEQGEENQGQGNEDYEGQENEDYNQEY